MTDELALRYRQVAALERIADALDTGLDSGARLLRLAARHRPATLEQFVSLMLDDVTEAAEHPGVTDAGE